MKNRFFISDTHFSHGNILNFKNSCGKPVRPFASEEEMDEELIKRWNSVVRQQDKVYHLGDVAIPRRGLKVLERLNGSKILIKGNHDIFPLKDYTPYFKDIRGAMVMDNIVFTHIPVHTGSKGRFKANVHGHLHTNKVKKKNIFGFKVNDPFYINVSVEQIDYTPISYEDLIERINNF